MPTDCGLKPPIEALPQIAHARDIVLQDSESIWKRRSETAAPAGYYNTTPSAEGWQPGPGQSVEEMEEREVRRVVRTTGESVSGRRSRINSSPQPW